MGVVGAEAFRQTLIDRCYVDTLDVETDGFGSARPAPEWTEGGQSWKCRVEQHRAIEVLTDSKIELATATVWVNPAAEVVTANRLRITRRNHRTLTTPETYAVLQVANTGFALKCECKLAKGKTAL